MGGVDCLMIRRDTVYSLLLVPRELRPCSKRKGVEAASHGRRPSGWHGDERGQNCCPARSIKGALQTLIGQSQLYHGTKVIRPTIGGA